MQPVRGDLRLERTADAGRAGDVERARRVQDGRPEGDGVAGLRENRAALLQRDHLWVPLGIALSGRAPPHAACHEQQERIAKKARPVLRDARFHTSNVAAQPARAKWTVPRKRESLTA